MKWLTFIFHLVLVGAAFTAQTVNSLSASTGDADATPSPPFELKNVTLGSSKASADTPKEKKREIPDALVDHPEEFERSEENKGKDIPTVFLREITDAENGPISETSNLDEDANEYPFYETEERRKRTADKLLGRSKRHSRIDLDVNEHVIELLELLNKGRHADHETPSDQVEWDEPTAEESDRAANAVLEALGYGKNAARYWPEGPLNTDELIPIAKVRVPFNRRPIL